MNFWLGCNLSVFSALWLSRFSTVSGGSDSASVAAIPTLSTSSFSILSSTVPTSASPPHSMSSASLLSVSSLPTTLATASISTAKTVVTQSQLSPVPPKPPMTASGAPPPSQSPTQNHTEVFDWGPEKGGTFGNSVIQNHCKKPVFLSSVGSYKLGGFRNVSDITTSWGTDQEQVVHTIQPGETYTEPFRTVCAIYLNTSIPGYCWPEDKLAGQGISIKISADEHNFTNILQFEYALIQNPARGDTYRRLDYDVSLLDCADPLVYPQEYKVFIASSTTPGASIAAAATGAARADGYRDVSQLTDAKANNEDHALKVKYCPGFESGLNVTFSNATQEICPSIVCDGKQVCKDIYTFDRSREGEATKACEAEYHGNIVLHLCAGMAGT